jgi:hypothetical protein
VIYSLILRLHILNRNPLSFFLSLLKPSQCLLGVNIKVCVSITLPLIRRQETLHKSHCVKLSSNSTQNKRSVFTLCSKLNICFPVLWLNYSLK